MESTIGLYKTELIGLHPRSFTGAAELERETAEWVHWYNAARLHSSIGYLPPIEYEANYRVTATAPTGTSPKPSLHVNHGDSDRA